MEERAEIQERPAHPNSRYVPNRSGYLGVALRLDHPKRPFLVRVSDNGKRVNFGFYKTAQEAALVYDKAVLALHGIHANVNFKEAKNVTR